MTLLAAKLLLAPLCVAAGRQILGSGGPRDSYHGSMSVPQLPGGVVHDLPTDLRQALIASAPALEAWQDITPLARNEFICWVEDAKQEKTRERRIRRTREELEEGQRRPCCWPGCKHRERNGAPSLTVNRRPVADILPHVEARDPWVPSSSELRRIVNEASADPGLLDDLDDVRGAELDD